MIDATDNAMVLTSHLGFAIVLFIAINWVGRRSSASGYIELSVLAKTDEAPAFNLILRILGPVVFLLLLSETLYRLDMELLVANLFLVVVYYFLIRMLFNVLVGRGRLVDWWRFLAHGVVSSLLAWIVYRHLIAERETLIPDVNTLRDQVWWLVIAYLYLIFNRKKDPSPRTAKRKRAYVHRRYEVLRERFGAIVNAVTGNEKQQLLIFSVMIIEDFNRPPVFRFFERLAARAHVANTFGIMQVRADSPVSDAESVRLGSQKIVGDIKQSVEQSENPLLLMRKHLDHERFNDSFERVLIHEVLTKYNPSGDYARDIAVVYDELLKTLANQNDVWLHDELSFPETST